MVLMARAMLVMMLVQCKCNTEEYKEARFY